MDFFILYQTFNIRLTGRASLQCCEHYEHYKLYKLLTDVFQSHIPDKGNGFGNIFL